MGAITATLADKTEFSGDYKLVSVTATVASSDDSMTFTNAAHGIDTVDCIVGAAITGGLDAAFTAIQVSVSDGANGVVQVESFEQDGTAATDFTGTTIAVTVLGR